MMEQEVVDYIQQAQKHGLSDFEIKQNLINVGWEAATVEDSMVFAKAAESKTMSTTRPQQKDLELSPITPGLSATQGAGEGSNNLIPSTPGISFQKSEPVHRPLFKNPLLWLVLAIALLAGGGAFAYFNFQTPSPDKVLSKFLAGSVKSAAFTTDYSISYSDVTATTTGPISVSLSGVLNSDLSDINNPKQQNNITAAFSYGIANLSLNFKYLLLGQVIYFDISQIPQLKAYLPDSNIQWVKVDLNELKNQKSNPELGQAFGSLSSNTALENQLKAIWAKAQIIKLATSLTKENLNGAAVYHLKGQVDNQALSAAIISSIEAAQASASSTSPTLTSEDKQTLTALINKIKAKEFDIWIGQKDSLLYKFHLLLSAPTIKDLSSEAFLDSAPGLGGAKSKSRDAKRLADVRQMAAAFELYYNDYGGYPAAGPNGAPQDISPTYIGLVPTAPEPADGSCTDYYNGYWYSPDGSPKAVNGVKVYPSYDLTFCLGQDTGGFKAGIAKLAPSGITDNIACPSTPQQCVNSSPQSSDLANSALTQAVNQMTFGGELKIDSTYSDYGKAQNLKAPDTSTDILDLIKGITGGSQPTTTSAMQN